MARRLTQAERNIRDLTERDFQVAYVRALRAAGFLVGHHYDSRFSDPGTKGMPDLVIVGHGWFWMEELKRQQGELRPDQEAWLLQLSPQVDVYVSRPMDWDEMMNRIEERSGITLSQLYRRFPQARKRKTKAKARPPLAPDQAKSASKRSPVTTRSTGSAEP